MAGFKDLIPADLMTTMKHAFKPSSLTQADLGNMAAEQYAHGSPLELDQNDIQAPLKNQAVANNKKSGHSFT